MTVRSARVVLTADASQAIREADRFGDAYEKSAGRVTRAGVDTDRAWQLAGNAGRNVAIGGVAVLGAVAKANVTFDKAMSGVSAASMAGERDLGRLRKAAIEAGADTQYSATEAAQGITELSKAGVSTGQILGGGLDGALALAAAGQIEVADAAETAASAMTQFKLKGDQVPRVADLLAAGAGKAQGGVNELSMALGQSGLIAAQTGLSIEDTVGGLTAFASAGLLGSDAGTSFKTMLMSLNPRSKEAADLMKAYNIEAYDAQGNFVGLEEYAGKLKRGLSGLTDEQRNAALQTIFGSDAIRAANILYENGQKGIEGWIGKVDDQGYAAETAAKQTDNLAGDIERFTGSLESAFIGAGSGAQDGLRDVVQGAEDLVDSFSKLPDAVQENSVEAVAKLTAAGGLLWALSKGRKIMTDLRGPSAGGGLSAGSALGGAAAGPVPVFVTNMGPSGLGGGVDGKGKTAPVPVGGGKTTPVPVGAGGAARTPRARPTAGAVAGGAANAALIAGGALTVMSSLSESLDDIRVKGKETGNDLFKAFEKPKSTTDSILFGSGNTLEADFDRATRFLDGGKAAEFDAKLSRFFSLTGGTATTKGLDNVRDLDKGLADLYKQDPTAAFGTLDEIVEKTGRSMSEVTSVLPKTAAAMRGTKDEVGGIGSLLAQTNPQIAGYGNLLRGMPAEVVTRVTAEDTDLTRRDVRQLKNQYDLTPRQVETLMKLVGDGPARRRLAEFQVQMATTDAIQALPLLGLRGADRARADVGGVRQSVRALDRDQATPRITQRGAAGTIGDLLGVGRAVDAVDAKKAKPKISVGGVGAALAAAASIGRALDAAARPRTATIRTQRLSGGSIGGAVPAAGGGTVPHTGLGYADRHYYLLADDEEVVSDRFGQATRYRPVLKAINADLPRAQIRAMLADGGTTGGASDRATLAKLQATIPALAGRASVAILMPDPAVSRAVLADAQGIAVAAALSTRSTRETQKAGLQIMQQQQRLNQLQGQLNETERYGKGKKKKSRLAVRGYDRDVLLAEIEEEKRVLADLQNRQDEVDAAISTFNDDRAAAAEAARAEQQSAVEGLTSGLDIFSRGASIASAQRYVDRWTADAATYGAVISQLAGKASPILLQQIKAQADRGNFRAAAKMGQALLNNPAALGRLNASLGVTSGVIDSLASLATDPRFLGGGFGSAPFMQVAPQQTTITLAADPSTWMAQILTQVEHIVDRRLDVMAN